jgi:hypothetical protein
MYLRLPVQAFHTRWSAFNVNNDINVYAGSASISRVSNRFDRLKIADRRHYGLPCLEGGNIAHVQHGIGVARGHDPGIVAILADKRVGHPVYLFCPYD